MLTNYNAINHNAINHNATNHDASTTAIHNIAGLRCCDLLGRPQHSACDSNMVASQGGDVC